MIGYIEKTVDILQDKRPRKAQQVPASLFYREEGLGIHFSENGNKAKLKYMPFNLFTTEKHKLSFKVSDHPLQDGTTVSDHVHQEMREVTIEGMFTNHPLRPLEEVNEVKFKDEYATSEVKPSVSNTALANFEKLKQLAKKREPVRLVCSLEIYPKMVITGIDYDRDEKSGSSIRFTMTLREIEIVSLKTGIKMEYDFQPEELKTANDRMIEAQKSQGQKTAETQNAEEYVRQMKKAYENEVFQ